MLESRYNETDSGKFEIGQVVATPGALAALDDARITPNMLLGRHHRGDWGDLGAEDEEENELSLNEGFRLLSAYRLPRTGRKIWIITEADRSLTTVLLPEEY